MVKCYTNSVSLSGLWVSSNDKLSDFYASSWQRGESPIPMLVIRVLLSAVSLTTLVWSVVEDPSYYWFIFLTHCGLMLGAMTMLSGTLTSVICFCKTPAESTELPWYASMYWLLFNMSASVALLITALYWVLLYKPDPEVFVPRLFGLDVLTHGVNSCIVAVELVAARTPVRWLHVYQPLGVGLWYSAFTYIYYAAGGTDEKGNPYIYEVLDWRKERSAGVIVAGSVAGLLVIYAILWAVALCRDKLSAALLRSPEHEVDLASPQKNTRSNDPITIKF